MQVLDYLKELYFKAEEKYYSFMDWLDEKGLPAYSFIDFFEEKNIPSFQAFTAIILFFILFLSALIFFVFQPEPQTGNLALYVVDSAGEPLPNARVSVSYGSISDSKTTLSDGKVVFGPIAVNELVKYSVEKKGFETVEGSTLIHTNQTINEEVQLNLKGQKKIKKTIRFYEAGTGNTRLVMEEFNVHFQCANFDVEYDARKKVVGGEVLLDDIPKNCSKLLVKDLPAQLKPKNDVFLSEAFPKVELERRDAGKGRIEVKVLDKETAKELNGFLVTIYRTNGTVFTEDDQAVLGATKRSNENGLAIFEDIPTGEYYAVVSEEFGYGGNKSIPVTVMDNRTANISIELNKLLLETISINLLNEKGFPARNVLVSIKKNNLTKKSAYTNDFGRIDFNLQKGAYIASIDDPKYFVFQKEVETGKEPYTFTLKSAVGNTGLLRVKVVDSTGKSVEGVPVLLKKSDTAEPFGNPKVSDSSGIAEFSNIPQGTYYAIAENPGFLGSESIPTKNFTLNARETLEVQLVVFIGKGKINVSVLNESGESVSNAKISAFDSVTGEKIVEKHSNLNGKTEFEFRIDKKPFFVVEKEGFLPYTTTSVTLSNNSQELKEIVLRKNVSDLQATLVSVKYFDSDVLRTVAAGQEYTANLKLFVPKNNSPFFGLFVRTGEFRNKGKTSTVQDNVFISRTTDSFGVTRRGTSYSNPPNFSEDLNPQQITGTREAKWVDIEFHSNKELPKYGVFEASVSFFVKDFALEGETVIFSYRGYMQTAKGFKGDPETKAVNKQELFYSPTKDKFFTVGNLEICNAGFCHLFNYKRKSDGFKTNIFEVMQVNQDSEYSLGFTFNKDLPGTISNAVLEINTGSGLELLNLNYTLPDNTEKQETNPGRIMRIPLNTWQQNGTLFGEIEFIPTGSSATSIEFTIKKEGSEVFSKNISIDIIPSKQAKMQVLPVEIVPLIDNKVMVKIFELGEENKEIPVPGFNVKAEIDGTTIAAGETDNDGFFAFEAKNPREGSKLSIKASKNGYKRIEQEKLIDSTILFFEPPELSASVFLDSENESLIEFSAVNYLPLKLRIEEIAVEQDEKELFQFSGLKEYNGLELENGKKQEFVLKARLTEKGKKSSETQQEDLMLRIRVSDPESNTFWDNYLPLTARVLLGTELEEENCIVLEPVEWRISTENRKTTKKIKLTNTCRTSKGFASITGLMVKVLSETEAGKFYIESPALNIEKKDINSDNVTLKDIFSKQETITFTLSFSPDKKIKSFEGTASIVFTGFHNSVAGLESVSATLSVPITINKISECLNIVKDQEIELRTCSNNVGQNFFEQQFFGFQTPITANNFFGQQQSVYPFSPVFRPMQTQQFSEPSQNSFSCDENGSFIIENNCTEDIEVVLDPHTAVNVGEKRFTLARGESKTVEVMPGIRNGAFPVNIRARLKSSVSEFKKIDSVKVKILSLQDIAEQCKPIVVPTRFTVPFTGFSKTAGKIINNCYGLHYRLQPLSETDFVCYTIDSSGRQLGACPLIEAVFSDTPRVIKKSESESVEVMSFGLKYNTDIAEQWPGFVEGTPEEQIGNLRFSIGRLFASVESPGFINIRFTTPFNSSPTSVSRNVEFVDPLQWIGAISVIMKRGSPNLEPAQCIRREAFDLVQEIGDLKDEDFVNNKFVFKANPPKHEYVMPMPVNNEDVESGLYCGEADRIEKIKVRSYTDPNSRVKVSFRLSHSQHHAIVEVDRSNMVTECADIEFENTVSARRVLQKQGIQEVKMPVKIRVLNKGIKEFSPGCENRFISEKTGIVQQNLGACTETGNQFYTKLGFEKLKISWNAKDFKEKTCEPKEDGGEGFFCDATQFSLMLADKIKGVEKSARELENLYQEQNLSNVLKVLNSINGMQKELEKPGNAFRISKKQIIVRDSFGFSSNKLFFLKNTDSIPKILEPEKKECDVTGVINNLGAIANELEGITDKSKKEVLKNTVNRVSEQLNVCYAQQGLSTENILVLLDETSDSDFRAGESAKVWEQFVNKTGLFKSQPSIIEFEPQTNNFIMTFNEFKKMELDLIKQGGKKDDSKISVIYGNKIISAKKSAWTEFLNKFYAHSTFVAGIRNYVNMPPELKEFVRNNAADISSETETINEVEKSGKALLISDNYSKKFSEDFARVYSGLPGFKNKKFVFTLYKRFEDGEFLEPLNATSVPPGEYAYRVEISLKQKLGFPFFSGNKSIPEITEFVVKLAPLKSLSEINPFYSNNVFFYTPFDATLMEGNKKDYGTGFENTPVTGLNYYFNSAFDFVSVSPSKSTFKQFYIDTRQGLQDTRQGNILELSTTKKRIVYTPSIPKRIQVKWDSDTVNEIYYFLNPARYDRLSGLLTWKSETGAKKADLLDSYPPPSFCENWKGKRTLFRARLEPGEWNGIIFVPFEFSSLLFELFCAKEFTRVSSAGINGFEQETSKTKGFEGSSLNLTDRKIPINSFREIFEQLKQGNVCLINASSSTALFEWNPAAILGETNVGQESLFTENNFVPENNITDNNSVLTDLNTQNDLNAGENK